MDKRWIVFCDFDGTITERDMIMAIMERFGRPGWRETADEILKGKVSIQEGVGRMFAQIPSGEREEIVHHALDVARIRPGFPEFLQYCRRENIDFLVTSGGIDFFVLPILAPYVEKEHIYCNSADFSGECIRILWPHGCDAACDGGCGLCKPSIMRLYPADLYHRVVIGDSITDWKAAQLADFVFARSWLLDKCREAGRRHTPFETFFDVLDHLRQIRR